MVRAWNKGRKRRAQSGAAASSVGAVSDATTAVHSTESTSASTSAGQPEAIGDGASTAKQLLAADATREFTLPDLYLTNDASSIATLWRDVIGEVSRGWRAAVTSSDDVRPLLARMRHCLAHATPAQLSCQLTGWCQFLGAGLRAQVWTRAATCRTLRQLLAEAERIEDSARLLSAGLMTSLLTALIDPHAEISVCSLNCLHQALRSHSRACGQHKADIQRYLMEHVESTRPEIAAAAHRCLAALPGVGASGVSGAALATAWSEQALRLIRTCHDTLDLLLEGIAEPQLFEVPDASAAVGLRRLEPCDPAHERYLLCRRVTSLLQIVNCQLSCGTRQPVAVPVSHLLQLISRCLSVSPWSDDVTDDVSSLHALPMEIRTVYVTMPDVHAAALRLLATAILCCGRSMLMRASFVRHLLLMSLRRRPPGGSASGADTAARCQATRALRIWLLVAGAAGFYGNDSGAASQLTKLVRSLLSDCVSSQQQPTTAKQQSTLNANMQKPNGIANNKGGKRKRSSAAAADWPSATAQRRDRPINQVHRTAASQSAAIQTLTQLVTSLGPLLPASVHKELQTVSLHQLRDVGLEPANSSSSPCSPRADWLMLISALTVSSQPDWPPPHQPAAPLISRALSHPNPAVLASCQQMAAVWSRSVRPCGAALSFPADLTAPARCDSPESADDADGAVSRPPSQQSAGCHDNGTTTRTEHGSEPATVRVEDVSEPSAAPSGLEDRSDLARTEDGSESVESPIKNGDESATTTRAKLETKSPAVPPPVNVVATVTLDSSGEEPEEIPVPTSSRGTSGSPMDLDDSSEDSIGADEGHVGGSEGSIVLGSDGDAENQDPDLEIVEHRSYTSNGGDTTPGLAADVAAMLRDFVNVDPEVE